MNACLCLLKQAVFGCLSLSGARKDLGGNCDQRTFVTSTRLLSKLGGLSIESINAVPVLAP